LFLWRQVREFIALTKTSVWKNDFKHDINYKPKKTNKGRCARDVSYGEEKSTAREQQTLHLQAKWKYFSLHGTRYVRWSKTTQMTSKPAVAIFLVGVDQSGQPPDHMVCAFMEGTVHRHYSLYYSVGSI